MCFVTLYSSRFDNQKIDMKNVQYIARNKSFFFRSLIAYFKSLLLGFFLILNGPLFIIILFFTFNQNSQLFDSYKSLHLRRLGD